MHRRTFLKGTASAGAAGAALSTFAAPAISQGLMEWRMITTWSKDFPGLGTGAEMLARLINSGTNGRLTIKVFGAGEIVPAMQAMDAVSRGVVEMGHGAPYYWKPKLPAVQFLASFPFGLTAREQNAWFQYGGGQQVADEIYRSLGCKFFPSGNTDAQMGGWFNREINELSDFKGLKMRIPGLGGDVIRAAGGNVASLPGAEIPAALQIGMIDAAEWVGPYNDLALGMHKSARYYYYPGWHEPATTLDNFINLAAWEKLPSDIKTIIEIANETVNQRVHSEFVARNSGSLRTLIDEHGVVLKKFPETVLESLGRLSGDVLHTLASKDPLSRSVMDSLLRFRKTAAAWTARSETAFTVARALPYRFTEPKSG